ncbi:MAG TPA: zf-TFIIB domain-containing protein [Gaiellaceae bacterium]|nr:zf-TFIIB domain-containing protein [Gaiellaceae bacterium]
MTREPMRCPNDGARLVEIERSEILVDACPECRGVWLDRGELDKILVRERQLRAGDADEDFFAEVEGRERSAGAPREREDEPQRGRRKRSFFEDLLDFD